MTTIFTVYPPLSTMQKQNAATRKIIRACVGTAGGRLRENAGTRLMFRRA